MLEKFEGGAGGSPETVDRLIRIADCENIPFLAREHVQDLDLREIRVLEFIHQDKASVLTLSFDQIRIALKKIVSMGNHVPEGSQILLSQHSFDDRIDVGDLLAALADLFIGEGGDILRLRHPRNREFPALQAANVLLIALRPNQFVLTSADEVQQVIQELGNLGGAHKIIELQFADTASQINPEILVIDYLETPAIAN